ncbi:MAG: hypothetical protein H7144_17280 [Burkholderiales bacterium]|nr:hypothetical protein [Phycisphaerae bacterium]
MPLGPIDPDTGERQTLDEIREWHRGMIEALVEQRTSVTRAIREGLAVTTRFATMTDADFDGYFDVQQRELERLTMLNLVASAEASIKDDFFHRVRKNLKDPLSRAYQNWYKELSPGKKRRPDFDEGGILQVLKDVRVMNSHVVEGYRECLRPRHWFGHGRNWDKPVEVDRLDPDDVYDRADALLRAMPT